MRTSILFCTLLFTGCVVEADDELAPETSEEEFPINGSFTPVNCDPIQLPKLSAAVDYADAMLDNPAFKKCVRDAFLVGRNGAMAETIVSSLATGSTTIECTDDACGGAGCGAPGPEYIKILNSNINGHTAEFVGRTILHEVAHNRGWTHKDAELDAAYSSSVNEVVRLCAQDLDVFGWSRDQPHEDTSLSPIGGTGGTPFMLRCPASTTVRGLNVDASTYVNRMSLRCSNGTTTASVGSFKDSTTTVTTQCPSGSSLFGFQQYAGSIVRRITGLCASNADLAAEAPAPVPTQQINYGGQITQTFVPRQCPVGMAVVGAMGRHGARIDQISWICEDVDGAHLPPPHWGGYRGTQTGTGNYTMCAGAGAAFGIYGLEGAEVVRLGVECYPTTQYDEQGFITGLPRMLEGLQEKHALEHSGGDGDSDEFAVECPSGYAIVGLTYLSGARIDAIGALCAPSEEWAQGIKDSVYAAGMAGGVTGTYSTVYCPDEEFVVGLRAWAKPTPEQGGATTVHAAGPLCRRLGL
jgi:hypothetical protein